MADIALRVDPKIIIGADTVNRIGPLSSKRGSKVLLACEQGLNEQAKRISDIIEDSGIKAIRYDEVPLQMNAESAEHIASLAKGACCDLIVGLGGVHTQATGRLASILTSSNYDLYEIFDGRKETAFVPYLAIPTSGEDPFLLSNYLLLSDPRDKIVKLIRTPRSLCSVVILDPNLSRIQGDEEENALSADMMSAILDGLCSALEAYCSTKSNFLSDTILEKAISLYSSLIAGDKTEAADFTGSILNAGLLMSLGTACSAAGIGTALSYSISGRFPVTKSSCSAIMLPHIMEKLISCRPEKMEKAENLTPSSVRSCMEKLSIPSKLGDLALSLDKLSSVAENARDLEFVAHSPWPVTCDDAYDLVKQAF